MVVVHVAADFVGARRVGAWNQVDCARLPRCTHAPFFVTVAPVMFGKPHLNNVLRSDHVHLQK